MTNRIFKAIFGVSLSVLVLAMIGIVWTLYGTLYQEQLGQLSMQAELIAQVLNEESDDQLSMLDLDSYRLTLISPQGEVLYDSGGHEEELPNHLKRQEIIEADRSGTGSSVRFSDTLSEETYNVAKKLNNGSFIRLSVAHRSMLGLFAAAAVPLVAFVLLALVLSWVLARSLARNIVRPINNIDFDHPLQTRTYPQLEPLLHRLEANNSRIQEQMKELSRKSEEFDAVSDNMDEGLLLLTGSYRILSCNRAAREIFDIYEGWHPFEDAELKSLLEEARTRKRATRRTKRHGRRYIMEAAVIDQNEEKSGMVVLILDVTEKEEAEKRRREFTANVTHELKTPLQTISSSAELLQSGMVKSEDVGRFAGYINTEAARMTGLINDIIHLSRLDEQECSSNETASLDEALRQAADRLSGMASMDRIDLQLDLIPARVKGSASDLQDIVFNLMENAVKYGRPGGYVRARITEEEDNALLEIEDNGEGIPQKDHQRIFERFYRVDKSHSRARAGSGLGLAIVRHAVDNLGGKISVRSKEKEGTVFLVSLPLAAKPEKQKQR